MAASDPPSALLPETLQDLPGAGAGWWTAAQEEIRQSEYQVTWQERTYLLDLAAAYQAPNRAQNLRTYFAPQGIRVIPRVFEGETPPWKWTLTLAGYGYAGAVQPVAAASLHSEGNRIEYRRGILTEWYVNGADGLEQGLTLPSPPPSASPSPQSTIVLELIPGGDLTARLSGDGEAIELTTRDAVTVLRYGDLIVTDAAGRRLPAYFSLSPGQDRPTVQPEGLLGEGEARIRLTINATSALYPITVDPTITGLATDPAWTAEGDQNWAWFGWSVRTAGDVNGDGYSDVIVGAPCYDGGQALEGRAYVYHGSAAGLDAAPFWTAESNRADAAFGCVGWDGGGRERRRLRRRHRRRELLRQRPAVRGAGLRLSTAARRAWRPSPAWTAESDQDNAEFGGSVGTAGDVNGDGYGDVIVGARYYNNGQPYEGQAYVYHGSPMGLGAGSAWTAEMRPGQRAVWLLGRNCGGCERRRLQRRHRRGALLRPTASRTKGGRTSTTAAAAGLGAGPAWTVESNQDHSGFGTSVGTAGDVNGDGYSDVIVGANCTTTARPTKGGRTSITAVRRAWALTQPGRRRATSAAPGLATRSGQRGT